jgi:hypothetical protein
MVYSEGDEGVKPANNKGYFANLDEFLAHVQKEYLVRDPQRSATATPWRPAWRGRSA